MNHKRIISIAASRLIRNAFVEKCMYRSIAYTTGKEIQKANKHRLIKKVLECANKRLKRRKLLSIQKQISNNWWVKAGANWQSKLTADHDGVVIPHDSGFVKRIMTQPRQTGKTFALLKE